MVLLGLFTGIFLFRQGLKRLNLRHLQLHGQEVPAEFEGHIQPDRLAKASRYVLESSRVDTWASVVDALLMVFFMFGGLLYVYDAWVTSLKASFHVKGVVFFLGLLYAEGLLGVPFSLYRNFVT